MRKRKYNSFILMALISFFSLATCATAKKLDKVPPTGITEAYYQNWVAGVQGGGSGTNIFIKTSSQDIVLDSVYFHNKVAKLSAQQSMPLFYIGRFSNDMNKEWENTNKNHTKRSEIKASEMANFPFQLKTNECVVSYMQDEKRKYFKISELEKKASDEYPVSRKKADNKI